MRTEALAAALALAAATAGCSGGDDCGPGDAPAAGITLAVGPDVMTFGGFTSSPNNDCTSGAVTSLTLEGSQVDAPSRAMALCLPAPDQLGAEPVALDDATRVQIIDVFAELGACTVRLDRTRALAGTATFTGLCADGTDPAGYALSLTGTLPLTRTCGTVMDGVDAALGGQVAVVAE